MSGSDTMSRLATVLFLITTPALAQNAETLRDCTPIGKTAGGVYLWLALHR